MMRPPWANPPTAYGTMSPIGTATIQVRTTIAKPGCAIGATECRHARTTRRGAGSRCAGRSRRRPWWCDRIPARTNRTSAAASAIFCGAMDPMMPGWGRGPRRAKTAITMDRWIVRWCSSTRIAGSAGGRPGGCAPGTARGRLRFASIQGSDGDRGARRAWTRRPIRVLAPGGATAASGRPEPRSRGAAVPAGRPAARRPHRRLPRSHRARVPARGPQPRLARAVPSAQHACSVDPAGDVGSAGDDLDRPRSWPSSARSPIHRGWRGWRGWGSTSTRALGVSIPECRSSPGDIAATMSSRSGCGPARSTRPGSSRRWWMTRGSSTATRWNRGSPTSTRGTCATRSAATCSIGPRWPMGAARAWVERRRGVREARGVRPHRRASPSRSRQPERRVWLAWLPVIREGRATSGTT